jgi:hypothetical protein
MTAHLKQAAIVAYYAPLVGYALWRWWEEN